MRAGIPSVTGAPRQYRGSTEQRIRQVLGEPVAPPLIFVHRDADSSDPIPRYIEVGSAAQALGCEGKVVAVVPVQELEAWLLTEEQAIREVVGRPNGRTSLNLPPVRRLEGTASPKEVLQQALLDASDRSGARLKKERGQFSNRRAALLGRLDIDGPVSQLPSWQRFVNDLNGAAARILGC